MKRFLLILASLLYLAFIILIWYLSRYEEYSAFCSAISIVMGIAMAKFLISREK